MDAEVDTDTFEHFYKLNLEEDMYKKPREVVAEDYEPRKILNPTQYKSPLQQLRDDEEEIKELQKDLRGDRIRAKTYQLLEILNEQQVEGRSENELNEAQRHIKDYFDNTPNREFFEMAKR